VTWAPCVFAGLALPPSPALRGVPAHGREDVPTDVVPALDADALRVAGHLDDLDITLRSSSGKQTPISITLPPNHGYFEIQPEAALEPYTAYTLTVLGELGYGAREPQELSLSFITGAGPLDSAPKPVSGVVQHWRAPHGASEDFAGEGACIGFSVPETDELVETRFTDPGYSNRPFPFSDDVGFDGLHAGTFLSDLSDGGNYFPPCVQFRRRAINGTFSEPTTTCGTYAPIYSVEGFDAQPSCTEAGFVSAEILDSSLPGATAHAAEGGSSSSCSLERPRGSPATSLVVLALGAGLAARRASERRRRLSPSSAPASDT